MTLVSEITPARLEQLRFMLESWGEVPDNEFNRIPPVLHYKIFKKGEEILREGNVCTQLIFVLKGCIRSYQLVDGKEVNTEFFFENQMAADFNSLLNETPSDHNMSALETTEVLYSLRKEYFDVIYQSLWFSNVALRYFQQLFVSKQKHNATFMSMSPEERYNWVLEHQAHLLQRVPLLHLASYLGMSRETLSRIRNRIS